MLVGDDPRFAVDAVEIERPGLSFMVDTLATISERNPGAELFLLVGADVPESFAKWREPDRITELATVVVLQRGGGFEHETEAEDGPDASAVRRRLRYLPTRRVDVSSTEIRRRVREGKSIRGFVPDAIAAFIAAEQLYC
jgi:nicotinate-nucleotide adenylyltransferase